MANESCLKPGFLKKDGYRSVKEWMETPNNVYTGISGGRYCVDPEDESHYKWYSFYRFPNTNSINSFLKSPSESPI